MSFGILHWQRQKKIKLNPTDDLKYFVRLVKNEKPICRTFFVTRQVSFINQVIGKYKNPRFDLGCDLTVEFRSFGTDELGVHAGGPTKEFETGGFKGIHFFEGEKDHLTPIYDYDMVSGPTNLCPRYARHMPGTAK